MFCQLGGQTCWRNLGELCPQSCLGFSQLASGCRNVSARLWSQPLGASARQGPGLLMLCTPSDPPPLPPGTCICVWHPVGTHRGSAEQLKLSPIQSCSVIGSWHCLSPFLLYLHPTSSFFKLCCAIVPSLICSCC